PYALGFAMFSDIKRMCDNPTEEDREWFPDTAGGDWLERVHFAMRNFKDESFILQFLSPKVMRDFRLFSIVDDEQQEMLEVAAIHDERGYRRIREALAAQYALSLREPNIQIHAANIRGDRSLLLHHVQDGRRPLGRSVYPVIRHLHQLWGFPVRLESINDEGSVARHYQWPLPDEEAKT
ncbi:MAG: SpoVR family protein, partial [Halomonadaceae bacterium]|nr:SpoVR family protein [Halomonadaceae bacterium]